MGSVFGPVRFLLSVCPLSWFLVHLYSFYEVLVPRRYFSYTFLYSFYEVLVPRRYFSYTFLYSFYEVLVPRRYFSYILNYEVLVPRKYFSYTFVYSFYEVLVPRRYFSYTFFIVFSSPGPKVLPSLGVRRLLSVVCKLFTFQASSPKPQGRLEPNLAGMFLGWSSTKLLFFVPVGYSIWLPGPIICSDWLKFQRSSLKLMN